MGERIKHARSYDKFTVPSVNRSKALCGPYVYYENIVSDQDKISCKTCIKKIECKKEADQILTTREL